MASFDDIGVAMETLLEEQGTPKNVKEKVTNMLVVVKDKSDPHLKADQLLMQLDDLQSDVNIPNYIRTQIWSISSMLEDLDV